MEPTKKKSLNLFFIFSLISLCIIGLFIIIYISAIKTPYNAYENNINTYIKQINKENLATEVFIKKGILDTQTAKTNLPKIISSLQKTKDKIQILVPSDTYKFHQISLIQGLTNNINMYVQLLNVLNNPEAMDISASRNNVKGFKEQCIKYYSQVNINKINIGLQKNTISFVDSSIYYIDQLVKIKSNQTIVISQNTDFINGIDGIFKNFQIIKTDFKAPLYSLRNNSSDSSRYDTLINLIAKNKTDLSDLKIELTKISVPEKSSSSNPLAVFEALKNNINDYGLYLDSFISALSSEKVQASYDSFDKNIADKLYTESDVKMATVIKDYNGFIEVYNGFKDIK